MAVVMITMAVMGLRLELVVLMVTTQSVGSVEHDVSLCSTMVHAMVMVTMVVMVIPMLVMVTVVLVVVLMITCSEVHDVSLPRGDTDAEIETLVS